MAKKPRSAVICGRMCEAPQGDYFATCSFDSNHIVLRSRLPYHIIKCLKNHPDHNKIQCPYDATEYIDPEDFPTHILTCESKRSFSDGKYETAELEASGKMGNIQQTPFFHSSIPPPDEDWSAPPDDDDGDGQREGVGRGTSIRRVIPVPTQGRGRAEVLKHIMKVYNERVSSLSNGSVGSSSQGSSVKDEDVCSGQFHDDRA